MVDDPKIGEWLWLAHKGVADGEPDEPSRIEVELIGRDRVLSDTAGPTRSYPLARLFRSEAEAWAAYVDDMSEWAATSARRHAAVVDRGLAAARRADQLAREARR